LSRRPVRRVELEDLWREPAGDVYVVVGSIISYVSAAVYSQQRARGPLPARVTIWGAGLRMRRNPGPCELNNLAVRGPLTRQALTRRGYHVGEGEGDPALLLPLLLPAERGDAVDVGIIPHLYDYDYNDGVEARHPWLRRGTETWVDESSGLRCKRLDVRTGNVEKFVEELVVCRHVVSVSLHGLILAEAYGIPHMWINLAASPAQQAQFKYGDFFAYLKRKLPTPVVVENESSMADVLQAGKFTLPQAHDLTGLLRTCPFRESGG